MHDRGDSIKAIFDDIFRTLCALGCSKIKTDSNSKRDTKLFLWAPILTQKQTSTNCDAILCFQHRYGFRKINTTHPIKTILSTKSSYNLIENCFSPRTRFDRQSIPRSRSNKSLNQTQSIKEISTALGQTSCLKIVFTGVVNDIR